MVLAAAAVSGGGAVCRPGVGHSWVETGRCAPPDARVAPALWDSSSEIGLDRSVRTRIVHEIDFYIISTI